MIDRSIKEKYQKQIQSVCIIADYYKILLSTLHKEMSVDDLKLYPSACKKKRFIDIIKDGRYTTHFVDQWAITAFGATGLKTNYKYSDGEIHDNSIFGNKKFEIKQLCGKKGNVSILPSILTGGGRKRKEKEFEKALHQNDRYFITDTHCPPIVRISAIPTLLLMSVFDSKGLVKDKYTSKQFYRIFYPLESISNIPWKYKNSLELNKKQIENNIKLFYDSSSDFYFDQNLEDTIKYTLENFNIRS